MYPLALLSNLYYIVKHWTFNGLSLVSELWREVPDDKKY